MTSLGSPVRDPSRRFAWFRAQTASPRVWLGAFALFVCASIILLFTIETLHARDVAVFVARRSAENLAESLAQQAADTFEAADSALLTIAERVDRDGMGPAARIRLRDEMAATVTTMPRLHGLTIADEHGRFMVGNLSASIGLLPPVYDRPYFQYHRLHPGSSIYISGPALGRVDNSLRIFVSRRLDYPDGRFAGVVFAPIALDYFEQTFAAVDVGRSGSIVLLADDGTALVRKPRKFIGQAFRNARVFADPYKYQLSGNYVSTSSIDHVVRLFAFRRLDRYPVVIDVGLATSDYLAEWRSDAVKTFLALVLVLAMIGGLAAGLSAQIGRRKRAEDALARLALLDGLTGIPNRRQFDERLEREWRAAARDGLPLALLMIDVDNFKAFNDRYGHQHGDDVLVLVARTIAAGIVRPGDVAARYGGEEFAAILPATDVPGAVTVAEHIRAAIVTLGVPHADAPNAIVTASIGVACIVPTATSDQSVLVEAADAALYEAKRSGRNRTSVTADTTRALRPAPHYGTR